MNLGNFDSVIYLVYWGAVVVMRKDLFLCFVLGIEMSGVFWTVCGSQENDYSF